MRIIEAFVERYGSERMKNKLPLRATSFDNFAELVQSNSGTEINASPIEKLIETGIGSGFGRYQCSTLYESRTSTGRKINFNEVHTTTEEFFGSDVLPKYALMSGDPDDQFFNIRRAITAEARLKDLEERLPGVKTHGPLKQLDDKTRVQVMTIAQRDEIRPFSKGAKIWQYKTRDI